jgi:flagellar protein FlgJ
MNASSTPDIYTEFSGLTRLRAEARTDAAAAVPSVAEQFEALFIQMMLKAMREATPDGGLLESHQNDLYRDLHDQQLALVMAKGRGMGLKEIIARQLGAMLPSDALQAPAAATPADPSQQTMSPAERRDAKPPFAASEPSATIPAPAPPTEVATHTKAQNPTAPGPAATTASAQTPPAAAPAPSAAATPVAGIAGPQNFVRELLPHARAAARELGVAPAALLAQAALETGWGRSLPRHPDGRSSYNLFGIKAGTSWKGAKVASPTIEFAGGVPLRTSAAFRAYGSYAESFQDYVRLVRDNPRYRDALTQASDPNAYLGALQSAGYATDPAYARKVGRLLGDERLRTALKDSAAGPLTDTRS